jgi:hypothetical protein
MKNSVSILLFVICLGAVLGLGWLLQPGRADEPPPSSDEIDKLIAQLGSESFEVREAATRQLQQREDAIPALRKALKSSEGEVARRAERILAFFVLQEKKRAFTKLAALAKNGQVDQAVEKLVRRKEWDDEDAAWQVMAELAGRLSDLEQKEFHKVSLQAAQPGEELLTRDFRRYREKMQPKVLSGSRLSPRELMGHGVVVRAEEIHTDVGKSASLLATSGRAKTLALDRSILFAGDSVEVKYVVFNSLIVCDGDVSVQGRIEDSLIIARGDVHCFDRVENSRIITAGNVCRHTNRAKLIDSEVKEKEGNLLGFVTFFDPAQVGIRVEKADGGLRVKEAAKDKSFARAGLRADDLVIAVDGDTVKDPEVFRRLLRAKLAVEGEMVVKVRRGEQALEFRVVCKE